MYPISSTIRRFPIFIRQSNTVYLAGFVIICAADTDKLIEDADRDKHLKYHRKANLDRSISYLRNRFWPILLEEDPSIRNHLLNHLCQDIAQRPEPVHPGRSHARKIPRNKRFPVAKKTVLP